MLPGRASSWPPLTKPPAPFTVGSSRVRFVAIGGERAVFLRTFLARSGASLSAACRPRTTFFLFLQRRRSCARGRICTSAVLQSSSVLHQEHEMVREFPSRCNSGASPF